MILGIIIRNFKGYDTATYIPVSNGEQFCGLVGRNGIGKSSVLEALDFFFNNKPFQTNIHSHLNDAKSQYVVPLFLIEKEAFSTFIEEETLRNCMNEFSDCIWNLQATENIQSPTYNTHYLDVLKSISLNISAIHPTISRDTHWILPIGEHADKSTSIGVFKDAIFLEAFDRSQHENSQMGKSKTKTLKQLTAAISEMKDEVKRLFQFIYIPKDVEAERLVQFEAEEIQALLGENLEKIIEDAIPKELILTISSKLKDFIDALSNAIDGYSFRVPGSKQSNIHAGKIYSLIARSFFSIRELHKENRDGRDLALKSLSSGEKQQALITLISSIITKYREDETRHVILALDEPESSLDIGACYDQFEVLYQTSKQCRQLIFTSHWYGFIPAIPKGSVTNIIAQTKETNRRQGFLFNIDTYREDIKLIGLNYSKTNKEVFPIDIVLKGSNDFMQAIFQSVSNATAYNWLICEGSTDKVYLAHYLHHLVANNKLRIIPVASAKEVKNIYNRLAVLFEEFTESAYKAELKGKVFLLTDTDTSLLEFKTLDRLEANLRCRRIVNIDKQGKKDATLVKIMDGIKGPNTDIEDALNGRVYHKTLLKLRNEAGWQLDFLQEETVDENSSLYALDLRPSEKKEVDDLLNMNHGANKEVFAYTYIEIDRAGSYAIPGWITEIVTYFQE